MPKRTLFLASLLFVLVACGRQPTSPAGEDSPALSWMNNPYNGNLRITRFNDGFIACWSDATNGLRACHSTIPLADGTLSCGPQAVLDPTIATQWVGLINELDLFTSWIRQNAKGQLWITVRDLNQPGTCAGNKLVAEGYGTLHNNDNDLFGGGSGGQNTNAWRFDGRGKLPTPTAGSVVYNGHINFVAGETVEFKELSASVQVQ